MPLGQIKELIEKNKDNQEVQNYLQGLVKPSLEGIKSFLEGNKDNEDVKKLLQGYSAVTPETIEELAKSNESIKKWLQSQKDTHFTKGLETWKEKTLPTILEEEIKKRFPDETEEQKRLRKLEEELQTEKQARIREALRNKAITHATSKGLPVDLVDFFVGQDEETTTANLEKLESIYFKAVQDAVEEKFKEYGRDPRNKDNEPPKIKDIDKMTMEDYAKMRKDKLYR